MKTLSHYMAIKFVIFFFFCSSHAMATSELRSNIDHSILKFNIPFLKISEVEGRFTSFKSKILFETKTKKLESIEISIDANSIDTGNKKRDRHLKQKDFLNTQKYPEIYFKSKEITKKGVKFEIKGNLNFMGKEIPMIIQSDFVGEEKDTWQKENFFFRFKGELNRKNLNLNWNKTIQNGGFLIGERIEISGMVQAQLSGEKTPFSRFMIPDSKTIRNRERVARGESELARKIVKKQIDLKVENSTKPQLSISKEEIKSTMSTPSEVFSTKEMISYIIMGFYGFVGAIALAVVFQHFFKKKDFENKKLGYVLKESIADTTAILIIVPYAVAMWLYLVS